MKQGPETLNNQSETSRVSNVSQSNINPQGSVSTNTESTNTEKSYLTLKGRPLDEQVRLSIQYMDDAWINTLKGKYSSTKSIECPCCKAKKEIKLGDKFMLHLLVEHPESRLKTEILKSSYLSNKRIESLRNMLGLHGCEKCGEYSRSKSKHICTESTKAKPYNEDMVLLKETSDNPDRILLQKALVLSQAIRVNTQPTDVANIPVIQTEVLTADVEHARPVIEDIKIPSTKKEPMIREDIERNAVNEDQSEQTPFNEFFEEENDRYNIPESFVNFHDKVPKTNPNSNPNSYPSVADKYLGKERILTLGNSWEPIKKEKNSYLTLSLKPLTSFKTEKFPTDENKYVEKKFDKNEEESFADYQLNLRYFYAHPAPNGAPYVFVLAGRGGDAHIPDDPNVHVVVVVTESQWEDKECVTLKKQLQDINRPIDFLVYSSPTPDLFDNIGMITWRRMAALMFAYKEKLDDFMMLDDNIDSLHFNENVVYGEKHPLELENRADSFQWSIAYNYLKMRAWNVYLIGMNNLKGQAVKFPSKVFFFNSNAIFKALKTHLSGDISALLPSKEHATLPMEDYYMHYALRSLHKEIYGKQCKNYNVDAYKVHLTKEEVAYIRTPKSQNLASHACQRMGKTAQEWITATVDLIQPKENAASRKLQEDVLDKMKEVVLNANAMYEKEQNKNTFDKLMQQYFLMNGTKDVETPQDKNALYDRMHAIYKKMRPHQRAAIEALPGISQDNLFPTFKLPTGSGKTLVQVYLAMLNYLEGKNVFIVTPLQNLVEQFYQAMVTEFNDPQNRAMNDPNAHPPVTLPVIKVMSKNGALSTELFESIFREVTQGEQKKNYIFIFCSDSYLKFLKMIHTSKNDPSKQVNPAVFQAIQIFDESHEMFKLKVIKDENTQVMSELTPKFSKNFLFSATPVKFSHHQKHAYKYKMESAIRNGVLPQYSIIPVNWGKKQTFQYERLKGYVSQTSGEGMIFVNSITECNKIAKALKEDFSGKEIVIIHSQTENLSSWMQKLQVHNPDRIILSCHMLLMGFNPPNISWIIDTVERKNPSVVVQVGGRLARSNNTAILDINGSSKVFYVHENSNLYKLYKQMGQYQKNPFNEKRLENDKKVAKYFGSLFHKKENYLEEIMEQLQITTQLGHRRVNDGNDDPNPYQNAYDPNNNPRNSDDPNAPQDSKEDGVNNIQKHFKKN